MTPFATGSINLVTDHTDTNNFSTYYCYSVQITGVLSDGYVYLSLTSYVYLTFWRTHTTVRDKKNTGCHFLTPLQRSSDQSCHTIGRYSTRHWEGN